MTIGNTAFTRNTAVSSGGAIMGESFGTLQINDTSTFNLNNANVVSGDSVYLSGSMGSLEIEESYFS